MTSHTMSDVRIRGNLTIMQRRGFLAALGSPVFDGSNGKGRVYRAIASERMPAMLQCESDAAVIEVRRYAGASKCAAELAKLLESHGAQIIVRNALAFQLGFPSLEARQVVWAQVTADSHWAELRGRAGLVAQEVSVFVEE